MVGDEVSLHRNGCVEGRVGDCDGLVQQTHARYVGLMVGAQDVSQEIHKTSVVIGPTGVMRIGSRLHGA